MSKIGWKGLKKGWGRLSVGAENALRMMREGRMSAPYAAPYEKVYESGILKLRHYRLPEAQEAEALPQPLLLIPPLMVTAEIYDISPELSAVAWLATQGVDVWLADFGSPEKEDGWDRTLDDHILAIDQAIARVAEETGHRVHLAGYSQGGMFAYQAAAFRESKDVASLITFGSPVDLHRNMPVKMHDSLAERVVSAARFALKGPIDDLKGIPGILNSYGFKMVSPRQEFKHLFKVMGLMHDEEALKRVLPTRRFLGGEGFIAWPGPAFRKFVDEYIVNNRLLSGGFVIDGKTVSLSDLKVPILCFVGEKDDIAKPAAVRAIRRAVAHEDVVELGIEAGHFGLVVGSKAMSEVWPRVVEWMAWQSGLQPRPVFAGGEAPALPEAAAPEGEAVEPAEDSTIQPLYDLATDLIDDVWHRLGEASLSAASLIHAMRWQLPRMARVISMHDDARVSLGRTLAEQAAAIPEVPFFLWRGQAYTYAEADHWVDRVAQALYAQGVRPRQRFGVSLQMHPGYLIAVAALNRLDAIPILIPPDHPKEALHHLLEKCHAKGLLVDRQHLPAEQQREELPPVMVLELPEKTGELPDDVVDLTAQLPQQLEPDLFRPNAGRAGDTAMIVLTAGASGPAKAVQITNRRWSMAALATAATCTLTPADTVYCSLPLHQSTGMLIAVGGALVGGSRLALSTRFSPTTFWNDVRRLGVTVAFYAGDFARYLLAHPPSGSEGQALRLLAGSGMPAEAWKTLQQRFIDLQIIEFYGSAEGNVILTNLQGDKEGALGRPLFGGESLAIARYDLERGAFVRDQEGFVQRCGPGQEGVLLSCIDHLASPFPFAPYADPRLSDDHFLRDVFEKGDVWFHTGDWMVQDGDGDFWFVDALHAMSTRDGCRISPREIALALQQAPFVSMSAVYTAASARGPQLMAALELLPGHTFDGEALFQRIKEQLEPPARPTFVRIVEKLRTTPSLRIDTGQLAEEGCEASQFDDALYRLAPQEGGYVPA